MGNLASDQKNARKYSLKLSRNTDSDILSKLDSVDSVQGYIKSLIRADIMKGDTTMNYITMDSFGSDLPANWEEIAAFLNSMIENELRQADELPQYGELSQEGREIVDSIWERFCSGEIEGCPVPEEEEQKMKIQFEAGTSRYSNDGVNFLICLEDDRLYAETVVPDGASDDYGYLALKAEILRQAAEAGINPDSLEFWYDGQEDSLEPDSKADCTVSR